MTNLKDYSEMTNEELFDDLHKINDTITSVNECLRLSEADYIYLEDLYLYNGKLNHIVENINNIIYDRLNDDK